MYKKYQNYTIYLGKKLLGKVCHFVIFVCISFYTFLTTDNQYF